MSAAPKQAQEATEAATTSCQRVAKRAKQISDSLTERTTRAATNPFEQVELHEEDSLVESIDNLVKTTKKE